MINYGITRNNKTTPWGIHGKLHVEGAHLIDEHGKVCQLRGLSTHNVSCYPEYVNPKTITELTNHFELDIFRFAMYSAFADDVKGYADGDDAHREELEKMLLECAEVTAELGIYLLVDWHILLDYDPNMHVDMAVSFFKKVSEMLRGYDHIIYEICNEPNMDCTWEQICNYANQVIPVIKNVDDSKVIIVGTPCWSQRVDEAAQAPLPYDNLMYTLHFYADTHRDDLRKLMVDAIEENELPIFVTEFGICDASGNGPVNKEQSDLWLDLMDKYQISYVLWNLSNKEETSAIIKSDCSKTTGFADGDFSPSGEYLYHMTRRA